MHLGSLSQIALSKIWLLVLIPRSRSNRPEVFCEEGVLRCNFIEKETGVFLRILWNFYEHRTFYIEQL